MTGTILPAEYIGSARHDNQGWLTIGQPDADGEGVVRLNLNRTGLDPNTNRHPGWWNDHTVDVYVRRLSTDLSVIEIHMARHDGLAQEELDEQNRQAT